MNGRGIPDEPRHSQRPSDRDLQHLLALYDGEIRYTDSYVDKLLQTFKDRGLLENTLVVLFGDHGDEFYEHGKTGHQRTLYNELLHVPLILSCPSRLPTGKRLDSLVSLIDVMPTILDYVNLPYTGPIQGSSIRPLIEGTADKVHDTVGAEVNCKTDVQLRVRAILNDRYKLVRDFNADAWELYRQDSDPGEHDNLFKQPDMADVCETLTAEWERWTKTNSVLAEELTQGAEAEKANLSEQRLQELRELGYMK